MDLIRKYRELKAQYETNLRTRRLAEGFLRDDERKQGELLAAVAQEAHRSGHGFPVVIEDPKTGTTTVPQTYEGLLAFICSWDALLLDEEMLGFKAVVNRMVPLKQEWQPRERERRRREKEHYDFIKSHDPETWDRMQGWKA